ncbi:MAG: aspartate kinase [Bacteroidia bacterium]|nr:aspartate kinase [Bacteroidia bacterium]
MHIFKFGGASVNSANAIKNVVEIIAQHQHTPLVIVVSAMGKMTNALELLVNNYYTKQPTHNALATIKNYHYAIVKELFTNATHPIYATLHNVFVTLEWELDDEPTKNYNHTYDQIVSAGELLSTHIVAAYLQHCNINATWIDARDCIKTDATYREGKVNWDWTAQCITNIVQPAPLQPCVIQGFIASNDENFTVTLGREGSDYTASILAYCLNATDVTIWKDVAGVLTADPKYFNDVELLSQLTYQDAVELTYYGATVIHPKTIKPLQNKNIPLHVRSFINYNAQGTSIGNYSYTHIAPSIIVKRAQVLLSISPRDFSFIVEENISYLFDAFARLNIKVHLMQNSALNLSIVTDDVVELDALLLELNQQYKLVYNKAVELITIRHYTNECIEKTLALKTKLVENKSRTTAQYVVSTITN